MSECIKGKETAVRLARFVALPVLALVMTPCTLAQLVATKDLTSSPAKPATPTEAPTTTSPASGEQERDCFIDHRDGAVVREVREKIRLEIVSADPRLVYDKAPILVTVRLKNEGDQPVLVPWRTVHVEPVRIGPNYETDYEQATIRVKLGTQEKRGQGTHLKGGAVLEAVPDKYDQHIQLLPGQWVEVKFSAFVECLYDTDWGCPGFKADQRAQLVAHWDEWLFTQQGQGCKAVTGAYKSRTIDSDPVGIVYVSSSPGEQEKTKP